MSIFNKVTKTFQWGQHTVTMETGEIASIDGQTSGRAEEAKVISPEDGEEEAAGAPPENQQSKTIAA